MVAGAGGEMAALASQGIEESETLETYSMASPSGLRRVGGIRQSTLVFHNRLPSSRRFSIIATSPETKTEGLA